MSTYQAWRRNGQRRVSALRWPWRERSHASVAASEPAQAMFGRIQRQLVLAYGAVLAAILVLSGLLLYLVMQQVLFNQVSDRLTSGAQRVAQEWLQHPGPGPGQQCSALLAGVPYEVCIYPDGGVTGVAPLGPGQGFLSPSFANAALAHGSAMDTVDGGHGIGPIQRYALAVHDPNDGDLLGIVQVGIPIQGQITALQDLATLLLLLGAITLLGAAVGGIILSRRALAPARLAFERQQAFIGDAGHELRTPLTLMRADAEVLLRGRDRLDPDDAALLEDIVAEASHMSALATSMLTLARLDAGAQQMERDVVDLSAVAADVVQRAEALAAEKQVTLALETPEKLLVLGDRGQLDQAALILLDNAIKYNQPGGSVTLRTYRSGPRACLEVRDTGIGIPAEHLGRLGERFYRVDKARSREAGGAGLGLAIARRIAAAHEGTLSFASTPGEGTAATLALPIATEKPAPR
jgi:signal transduction histidine kinase